MSASPDINPNYIKFYNDHIDNEYNCIVFIYYVIKDPLYIFEYPPLHEYGFHRLEQNYNEKEVQR